MSPATPTRDAMTRAPAPARSANGVRLYRRDGYWVGRFEAMASPCEILMEIDDGLLANRLASLAQAEALRVERKFSRYRDDNIVHRINTGGGVPLEVDAETADLLDYADQCYRLSEGGFDITSGVLRAAWRFDGSDRLPGRDEVAAVLARVGWPKVRWERPWLSVPAGMEIDFGGIGKEYAVDRTAALLRRECAASMVVNFGGDLFCTGPRAGDRAWSIGLDDPDATGQAAAGVIAIRGGGLATSGDARRYLLKDGVRYGHILDPRSGWPVQAAPRSVTVAADTCLEAGMLATFAMLRGAGAEAFLQSQGVRFRCL